MGRELKRVSLDFNWPLNKIWKGYLNPYHPSNCPSCETGYSKRYKELSDLWYGWNLPTERLSNGGQWHPGALQYNLDQQDVDLLAKKDRLADLTKDGHKPTAAEVNKWNRPLNGFGHDGINCWIVLKGRCKREGAPTECGTCNGRGHMWPEEKFEDLYQEWESIDPPKGEGFQLWQTTSEGSPATPVFETLADLCIYAAEHCTTFASHKATKDKWMEMLDSDFVFHKEGNAIFL